MGNAIFVRVTNNDMRHPYEAPSSEIVQLAADTPILQTSNQDFKEEGDNIFQFGGIMNPESALGSNDILGL